MEGKKNQKKLPTIFKNGENFRIILDADPSSVQKRVDLRNDELPLGEQTVAQVTNALHGLFW